MRKIQLCEKPGEALHMEETASAKAVWWHPRVPSEGQYDACKRKEKSGGQCRQDDNIEFCKSFKGV